MLRITWTKIPMIKFLFTVVLSSLVGLDLYLHIYHNYFKTSSESKRILGDPPCKGDGIAQIPTVPLKALSDRV